MGKVDVIQTSFVGGEFGPSLFGRTDIAQYANACEIVENFIPRPYGSAISTPGTRYVATVSDSTLKTRLIKFIFNRTDAYVIEMGDLYMRFFTNRGQVVDSVGTEDFTGPPDISGNLIAHWKCNDNTNSTVVLDAEGTHNGAATQNTASLTATGKVSGCFQLSGKDAIEINDHAELNFSDATTGTNPFSIAAWIYVKSAPLSQNILSKMDTGKQQYQFALSSSLRLQFALIDEANGGNRGKSTSPLSEGWHFVVATYDGRGGTNAEQGINIYVDEEIADTSIISSGTYVSMVTDTAKVAIGARYSGGALIRWFADKIDNVALLDKELTPAEVASLYDADVIYQITTPFTEDELFDVQFTQLNDIIWLTHPNHPPQRLIRTDAANWAISDLAFIGGPFMDDNLTATTITPSATTGTVNLTASTAVFTLSSGTLGHHNAYWKIGGLAQTNATTGLQEQGYVQITHVIDAYTATATVIKNLKASVATVVWAEGAWSDVRGWPARVAFHERRLFFARTNEEPQNVWGSKVFIYDDFALDDADDDDGLNLKLASNQSNEIQWLASGKSLIAGIYGGAFVINSGSTEPITPSNANASEENGVGSESIMPKKIGSFIYYVQRFGRKLREMFYFWDEDTYKAVDATILSPHILGDGIVDMDYQQNPDTVLYCVLTNGTLATLTREVDQQVQAWARQTTAGTYSSIAIIPSQTASYDEVWVIVERWIEGVQKRYVEVFENIEVPDRQELCLYLHSALTYNAYNSTSASQCSISLSATNGSITVTSSTDYFVTADDYVFTQKRIRAIGADGTILGEGFITAYTSATIVTVSVSTIFTAPNYSAGDWGKSVSSVSGLDHIEGESVGMLRDGEIKTIGATVSTGAVSIITFPTLTNNGFILSVGLLYDQIIFTLPKEAGSARGTAQGKIQRISEVAFKVNRSTQGFQYGGASDTLDTVNQAITPSVATLYTGIIPNLSLRSDYKRGAQVYIKNSIPLPVEILSVMSTLETFDK